MSTQATSAKTRSTLLFAAIAQGGRTKKQAPHLMGLTPTSSVETVLCIKNEDSIQKPNYYYHLIPNDSVLGLSDQIDSFHVTMNQLKNASNSDMKELFQRGVALLKSSYSFKAPFMEQKREQLENDLRLMEECMKAQVSNFNHTALIDPREYFKPPWCAIEINEKPPELIPALSPQNGFIAGSKEKENLARRSCKITAFAAGTLIGLGIILTATYFMPPFSWISFIP